MAEFYQNLAFFFKGTGLLQMTMTQEQRLAVARYALDTLEVLDSTAPSLDEEVERLKDLQKTTIAGMFLAVRLIFGKDEASELRQAVLAAFQSRHGHQPDLNPRVVASGADSGVFKKQIYGDLGLSAPPGPGSA